MRRRVAILSRPRDAGEVTRSARCVAWQAPRRASRIARRCRRSRATSSTRMWRSRTCGRRAPLQPCRHPTLTLQKSRACGEAARPRPLRRWVPGQGRVGPPKPHRRAAHLEEGALHCSAAFQAMAAQHTPAPLCVEPDQCNLYACFLRSVRGSVARLPIVWCHARYGEEGCCTGGSILITTS